MKNTIHVTKNSCVCIGIVLAFIVLLAGCSGGSPESVTKDFIKATEKNDLKAMSEVATERTVKLMSLFGDRFRARLAEEKIKTMKETINGDAALVNIIYESGEDDDIDLIKVDGKWKVEIQN
jgi:hypothetical protein